MRPETAPERSFSIRVNGEERAVPARCSVATLLATLGLSGRRLAIAVNRDVVPRSTWADRTLAPGDRVEILEAVGGG